MPKCRSCDKDVRSVTDLTIEVFITKDGLRHGPVRKKRLGLCEDCAKDTVEYVDQGLEVGSDI